MQRLLLLQQITPTAASDTFTFHQRPPLSSPACPPTATDPYMLRLHSTPNRHPHAPICYASTPPTRHIVAPPQPLPSRHASSPKAAPPQATTPSKTKKGKIRMVFFPFAYGDRPHTGHHIRQSQAINVVPATVLPLPKSLYRQQDRPTVSWLRPSPCPCRQAKPRLPRQ